MDVYKSRTFTYCGGMPARLGRAAATGSPGPCGGCPLGAASRSPRASRGAACWPRPDEPLRCASSSRRPRSAELPPPPRSLSAWARAAGGSARPGRPRNSSSSSSHLPACRATSSEALSSSPAARPCCVGASSPSARRSWSAASTRAATVHRWSSSSRLRSKSRGPRLASAGSPATAASRAAAMAASVWLAAPMASADSFSADRTRCRNALAEEELLLSGASAAPAPGFQSEAGCVGLQLPLLEAEAEAGAEAGARSLHYVLKARVIIIIIIIII